MKRDWKHVLTLAPAPDTVAESVSFFCGKCLTKTQIPWYSSSTMSNRIEWYTSAKTRKEPTHTNPRSSVASFEAHMQRTEGVSKRVCIQPDFYATYIHGPTDIRPPSQQKSHDKKETQTNTNQQYLPLFPSVTAGFDEVATNLPAD